VADSADTDVRIAPIVNSGELLGVLLICRAPGAEPFGADEERVLRELSRRTGLALRNLRLDSALQASLDELREQAAELRASRARVVAAADAERRRIERDIHDGAQQQLIALAVNVRVARQLAEADPKASRAMLAQVAKDLQDALEDVRALAHGIYPPLLLDGGLAPALRAAAARSALPVRVEADVPERYSAELEAAVYFCCLEALQNATKHAGAHASVSLRLRAADGLVSFEVSDDGLGFRVGNGAVGAGLASMSDRVGAAGGTLAVRSEPGHGTTVAGTIPVADG
jgi:signal transduction histidine kinase